MGRKKAVEGGERPHSHRSGSELFVCFTSRPSSSTTSATAAMRAPSSKSSLLSPGRGRDPAAPSLSASLSRRLRSSGSVKGGQSPMFPSVAAGGGGRKKGAPFEAAEPSSPKVTCIGQVRVKGKKKKRGHKGQAAMARSRSRRRDGGEASFRRPEESREEGEMGKERECFKNQRWVYQLSVSVCEALRAFGSELNCFIPCGGGRSPCSSSRTGDEERGRRGGGKRSAGASSCGAVLARWLMAVDESKEGKKGEVMGLVVEERGEREVGFAMRQREEREEAEELEVEEGIRKEREEMVVVEGEEARVSVCIPPRNALLLMRCRSDPVRMAALANRFWGSPATKVEVEEEEEEEEEEVDEEREVQGQDHGVEADGEEDGEEQGEEDASETGEAGTMVSKIEKNPRCVVLAVAREDKASLSEEKEATLGEQQQDRPSEGQQNGNGNVELNEGIVTSSFEMQRNPSPLGTEEEEQTEKNTQLPVNPEREGIADETHLLKREEKKEDEEERGRKSCSSNSSSREEKRSHRCFSKAREGGRRRNPSAKEKERRRHSFSVEREGRRHSFSNEKEARRSSFSIEGRRRWSFSMDKEDDLKPQEKPSQMKQETNIISNNKDESSPEGEEPIEQDEEETRVVGREEDARGQVEGQRETGEEEEEERRSRELPDCLLLMMCEPKLSMEVSKETWVRSTDFHRWPPHQRSRGHHPKDNAAGGGGGGDEAKSEGGENKTLAVEGDPSNRAWPAAPPPPPPAAAPPSASMGEQKLILPAYGPFVLTRCKSEPMRSSARLAPDACCWKERHLPVGATGVGF